MPKADASLTTDGYGKLCAGDGRDQQDRRQRECLHEVNNSLVCWGLE
jgi:hypothetical protein